MSGALESPDLLLSYSAITNNTNTHNQYTNNNPYLYFKKVYDPVRIIDTLHPYAGLSGMVTRIDTSIPGTPLYEVKIDGGETQTYVHT